MYLKLNGLRFSISLGPIFCNEKEGKKRNTLTKCLVIYLDCVRHLRAKQNKQWNYRGMKREKYWRDLFEIHSEITFSDVARDRSKSCNAFCIIMIHRKHKTENMMHDRRQANNKRVCAYTRHKNNANMVKRQQAKEKEGTRRERAVKIPT